MQLTFETTLTLKYKLTLHENTHFAQLLSRRLSNAITFTKHGGKRIKPAN